MGIFHEPFEIQLSGGTAATGQTTALLVHAVTRAGGSLKTNTDQLVTGATAQNILLPSKRQGLGARTGWTAKWSPGPGSGGSAFKLAANNVTTPYKVHVYVAKNPAYLIGYSVGTTYTGVTPAAYAKDQTHVFSVRDDTYLHWRARVSGETTNISVTSFGE